MYDVIWTYDGCPGKPASTPLGSVDECKILVIQMLDTHEDRFEKDPKLELAIRDLDTQRLVSYTL